MSKINSTLPPLRRTQRIEPFRNTAASAGVNAGRQYSTHPNSEKIRLSPEVLRQLAEQIMDSNARVATWNSELNDRECVALFKRLSVSIQNSSLSELSRYNSSPSELESL